jgi:large subunit ribosomal protein L15
MAKRFPKRGFRANRFNTYKPLEKLNLGKIAYFIQKGELDPKETITMKKLFETGIVNKITHGVKVLGQGAGKLKAISESMGTPINLEVSDASSGAVETIKSTGGSVQMVYRTPLLMRYYLKRHKFPEYVDLKTPMPSPKKVKKLEKIRDKGIEVEYPAAPWFTDNKEALAKEEEEKQRRIREATHAELLPEYPADRSPRSVQRLRI